MEGRGSTTQRRAGGVRVRVREPGRSSANGREKDAPRSRPGPSAAPSISPSLAYTFITAQRTFPTSVYLTKVRRYLLSKSVQAKEGAVSSSCHLHRHGLRWRLIGLMRVDLCRTDTSQVPSSRSHSHSHQLCGLSWHSLLRGIPRLIDRALPREWCFCY